MVMNLNLNIDEFGGKTVVPIMCREVHGTGFYIGNNLLLTAFHVVSDALYDGSKVIALIGGVENNCKVIPLGDSDVALLECLNPVDEEVIGRIQLLDAPFMKDLELEIIGYPQEIGNGIDYFGVCAKNQRELSNTDRGFDVVVQRTDAFGFNSYAVSRDRRF